MKSNYLGVDKIPFTDPFMFALVMQNEEICLGILRLLIPEENFTEVRKNDAFFNDSDRPKVETEVTRKYSFLGHGVRFDAFATSDNVWAEIEMQTAAHVHIGKRSRYYQGNMDLEALNKGIEYDRLPRSYVVFLCTFDYMGAGEPLYFFRNYDEKNNLPLDDESFKIIVNTKSSPEKIPEELKPLFDYINNRENADNNSLISQIDHEVDKYSGSEWRWKFVTYEEELNLKYKAGLRAGREEGREEGRLEGALELIIKQVKRGRLTIAEAAEDSGLDEATIRRYLTD